MNIHIVKSNAEQVLSDENTKLENQMDACQAQVEAVGDISLEGMEGAAAEAATQTIHMHKAVVESHYSLYESLRSANEKNKSAVSGLYPTEGDVVDTKVAEQRLQEAQNEIARLQEEERRDVSFARQQNRQTQRDGGSTESMIDVQSISDGYSSLIASQRETAQYYQKVIDVAKQYDSDSEGFYGEVDFSQLHAATASAISYAATRSWGDTSWADTADGDYNHSIAEYKCEMARPYLTDEELEAYRQAYEDDGRITSDEIYSVDEDGTTRFTEHLYAALAKVPSVMVSDAEVGEVAKAYETMWDQMDTDSIERLLELSYVATGREQDASGIGPVPDPNDSTKMVNPSHIYEYVPSSLLSRVAIAEKNDAQGWNNRSDRYWQRIAGLNLIDSISQKNETIWVPANDGGFDSDGNAWYSTDGVDFSLTVIRGKNADGSGDSAFMCVLESNPALHVDDASSMGGSSIGFSDPSGCARYETDVYVSGNTPDVLALLSHLNNPNARLQQVTDSVEGDMYSGDGFSITGSIAKSLASKGADITIGNLPGGGTLLTVMGFAKQLLEGYQNSLSDEQKQTLNEETVDAIRTSGSSPLEDIGIGTSYDDVNFPDFNSPDGTRSYTLDGNTNVYITDSEQKAIQSTIDAYNQLHGTSYTYDDFMSDMTNNPIDALIGQGEGQDTSDFLEWSKDPADLVYSQNIYDDNGVILHPIGSTVDSDDSISNYEFFHGKSLGKFQEFDYFFEE